MDWRNFAVECEVKISIFEICGTESDYLDMRVDHQDQTVLIPAL